ncbi:MAG: hypothetical protein LBG49_01135 [Mycoplasmataceae bacterium]|jgi:hypothetical protein|nr:hypothetical protein [Mycoplasmataceae bacterium]
MKENKEYEITKSSYSRLIGAIFECVIINKIVNKPPIWFQEFEKRNDARWAENDARWAKQEEFNKYVGDFIKQQVEFNKHVIDVFKRNNLK